MPRSRGKYHFPATQCHFRLAVDGDFSFTVDKLLLYGIKETPVRFQTTETVQTPDSEIVLRALETTLPEISSEVVRDGDQIILRGLGPSPRTRNPRDITVLHISSHQETTVIHADVNFQASALLGATSQDSVVRSKLDYVFDQVRSQLSLETRRDPVSELVPHSATFAPAIAPFVAEPALHSETEPVERSRWEFRAESEQTVSPAASPALPAERPFVPLFTRYEPIRVEPAVETVVEPAVEPFVELVAEEVVAAPESPGPAPAVESEPVDLAVPAEVKLIALAPVVEKVAVVPGSPVETAVAASVEPAKPRPEHPTLQFSSSLKAQRTHVPALIAAIVALLLLFAVAAYYLLRPNPPDPSPTSLPVKTQPVKQGPVFLSSTSGTGLSLNDFVADPAQFFQLA